MKIKIQVTQENIINGQPCEYYSCPIALAVKKQIGLKAKVYLNTIDIGKNHSFALPKRAKTFTSKFDSRKPVEPFNFWLNI